MFNNQREKTLAAVLGVAMALGCGFQAIDAWLLQPVDSIRNRVASTTAKNERLELDLQLVDHAQRNLKAICDQSLPPEPATASLMYQDWLMERVRNAKLNETVVTPGRAIVEDGIGHRIPFTVQAEGSLRNIGRFLDDFYRTPVLHRITFLKINNGGQTTSTARKLTMTLEALSLIDASPRESLPPPDRSVDHGMTRPNLENYFARTDPFRRTVFTPTEVIPVAKKTLATKTKTPTPRIDALATIRLVASISKNDQREAWFFDTRTDREFIVTVGEELSVNGFSGRVVSITADSITLASQDQSHITRLGQTIRESLKPSVN